MITTVKGIFLRGRAPLFVHRYQHQISRETNNSNYSNYGNVVKRKCKCNNMTDETTNAERGGEFLGGYSFHDISESIPEDDEDYSSTDGTYYSEELEAIMSPNGGGIGNGYEHKDDETTDDSFANDSYDDGDEFYMENDDNGYPRGSSYGLRESSAFEKDGTVISASFKTRSSEEFGDFASVQSHDRSQDSFDRKTFHSEEYSQDQEDGDSYTENDTESKTTRSSSNTTRKGDKHDLEGDTRNYSDASTSSSDSKSFNSGFSFRTKQGKDCSEMQPDLLGNTESKTRQRSHSSSSRERLVSDCEASVDSNKNESSNESLSHSSSSEEIITASDNEQSHSVEGVESQDSSFQFSSQWGSFGNLNERQPAIVSGDVFHSDMDTKDDNSTFRSKPKDDKNAKSRTENLFMNDFADDPFGGDPFSMVAAEEATQTNKKIVAKTRSFENATDNKHLEVSGTKKTGLSGTFPFAKFSSSNTKSSATKDDVESDSAFSENPPKSDGFNHDNKKRNLDKGSVLSGSSPGESAEVSDHDIPPHLALGENEVSSSSDFEKEHPNSLENQKDFDRGNINKEGDEEEESKLSHSQKSSKSSKGDDEESMPSRHEKNGSDRKSKDSLASDSVSRESDESRSFYSNVDSMESREEDYLWRETDDSSASFVENVDFNENSNNDDRSGFHPFGQGNEMSFPSNENVVKCLGLEEEPHGGTSDGLDPFASKSTNEEAAVETSISDENFESKPLVEKRNELFQASFGNDNEQSTSKDTPNVTNGIVNSTCENETSRETKASFEDTNESSCDLGFDRGDEPSDLINRTNTSNGDVLNGQNGSLARSARDGKDNSGNSVSSSSRYSDSKSLGDNVEESKITSNQRSDESFYSKSHDNDLFEVKLLGEEDKKSAISCSASSGYSAFRSFEDDADSSFNSDLDPSNRSCSDSSFHDSELSKSLRLDFQEAFNQPYDNFEHSKTASPKQGVEESMYPAFDRNDNSDGSSHEEEEVASKPGHSSNSISESPKASSEESTESHDEFKSGSRDTIFDKSEASKSGPMREAANEAHSSSVDSSDHQPPASVENEASRPKSIQDEANASEYSSSSFDSHKDFRSRSFNKRAVDESFNSAFDISRSESLGGPTSESSFHNSESSVSKPIEEQPDRPFQASPESASSGDHGKNSISRAETRLSNNDGKKNDQKDGSSSTHSAENAEIRTGQKNDSSSGNIEPQQASEKDNESVYNEPGENSEVSMLIGDVFEQPNELFEDSNKRHRSPKSAGITDYILQRKEQKDLVIPEAKEKENFDDNHSEALKIKLENEGSTQNENTKRNNGTKLISEKERRRKKRRRKERRKRKKEAKSPALLDFAANVNEAILDLEDRSESEQNIDSSANGLLHGFDALLGIFLQLSDEVELIATFSGLSKDDGSGAHVNALTAILDFAETFDQLFSDLKPIVFESLEEEEADEYMEDIFDRLDACVDLLCETSHRVGERQEWNCRAETTYVTLLELIERDTLDLRCYFDDVTTPDPGLSANVHEAWSATGHIEELKALQRNTDPKLFRQICYEVMVSTDQWCPDRETLMEICDIDPEILKEEYPQEHINEDDLAPIPQAAEHILDKVNGETLRRLDVFASVLRRILPPHAVSDASLRSRFTSIRNSIDSPLGLSATNVVSISSVPESINDPDALGVAGVGKTTLAAMVAEHRDVRRYFIDGIAWVHLGDEELNYNRYTQCLRELVAQLDFYDGIPLFAELLHTPGENPSKRKRREEGFMIYARDTIAGLLEDRSVLIILDDLCFEPDMDWFDFAPMPDESTASQGENCALVITTRRRFLLPASDTVEIDMLDEADAITLLIQESGQLSQTLMSESKEARSVVRECANHPLAVKSVGRWLNLKHATSGVASSVEEIHSEVIKSMDKILNAGDNTGTDMMYEILSTSLSPAINGGPTNIIKFCFAAFIMVFCDRNHISEFELTEPTPIIPMDIAELLFQTLLEMYEVSLLKKGSLFYAQKKEAAVLIPEALSALGVLKVITYSDTEEEENAEDEQKFLQVMHSIHHEYGVYLANDDRSLKDFTKDAERQWNRALVDAYLSRVREWDWDLEDAAHCYALEMIVSHMIRGKMDTAAANLLTERSFIRGRLKSLGRENCTKRYIKDCELLFKRLEERVPREPKLRARGVMKRAYQALGRELTINVEKNTQDARVKNVEVARAHYEIGFSLAENRCWDAAIAHWETSQELLSLALGPVEVVAGILFNIGAVYSELNEYEPSLNNLKQCLKIRATVHGGRFGETMLFEFIFRPESFSLPICFRGTCALCTDDSEDW